VSVSVNAPRDVLLCGALSPDERRAWLAALAAAMPCTRWHDLDEARQQPEAIEAAVVANPPPGSLQGWPRLRLIQSLWAGVDRLLADPTVPQDVAVARMVDPAMTQAMTETVLWAVLGLHRRFFAYARQQASGLWRRHDQRRADEVTVLVLGAGTMGSAAIEALRQRGYAVTGWRRADGRPALETCIAQAQIVVNLLPLTTLTRGLINTAFLGRLPPGAAVVNLARGAHLVEADLLAALDSGRLGHAVLDVFETEPLPAGHRFWTHPRVTVLPHAAAATDPRSAAAVVAENLRRLCCAEPLLHRVDRQRGY